MAIDLVSFPIVEIVIFHTFIVSLPGTDTAVAAVVCFNRGGRSSAEFHGPATWFLAECQDVLREWAPMGEMDGNGWKWMVI